MKYEYVLFDLDGTLTDPEEGITRSFQYALEFFGIHETDPEKLRSIIGPSLRGSFVRFGVAEADVEDAMVKYRERFGTIGLFENAAYEGIKDVLAQVKAQGAKVALATAKPTLYAVQIMERFGLAPYFDYMLGSEMDGRRGEKVEVIRDVLAHFGNPDPTTVVMVGDRRYDILGAKACGLAAVGVLYGYGSRAELEKAGADYLAQTVADLPHLLCEAPILQN